jgi:hypothetical protein
VKTLPGMSVQPDTLNVNRVYLADFDRITYSQVAWTPEDILQLTTSLEQKLKLLLLVKSHVIIPIPHLLESELAHEVIGRHPELFTSGAVVPSLQEGFSSVRDFLQKKLVDEDRFQASLYQGAGQDDIAAMVDESATIVHWNSVKATEWFRTRLLADLNDPHSLLRLAFKAQGLSLLPETIEQIEQHDKLSRTDVYKVAKGLGDLRQWELLANYADFVYYLGDALGVKSEGILPQENLLDFTLSDLASGDTSLSENEVFAKVFIDIVKAITSTHFPADFLDTLSIQDAIELHKIAIQTEFVEKYNAIQQKTKEGLSIHDPERLVLTLEELGNYEVELHRQFEYALRCELPIKLRERRSRGLAEMLHTIATLIIPFYGNVDAARQLLISGLTVTGRGEVVKRIKRRVVAGVDATQRLVDRRDISERPLLLEFVDRMKGRYVDYLSEEA